jgi:predicted dinucleotide-binding enzyme
MQIAVIGAGNIGGTLARKWGAAGHHVTLGVRDANKPEVQQLVAEIGANARADSIVQASERAEAVLFAVPAAAMADTLSTVGAALNGKLVIDATNNIGAPSGPVNHLAAIAAAAPDAVVYRAFNIYGWENFANPRLGGIQADLFYVGSADPAFRRRAEDLIGDVGLNPVWLGGLDHVDLVDQLLRLWFVLAFEQKRGRRMALKLLTD